MMLIWILIFLMLYIGFARNSYWEYLGLIADNDEVTVRFGNTRALNLHERDLFIYLFDISIERHCTRKDTS